MSRTGMMILRASDTELCDSHIVAVALESRSGYWDVVFPGGTEKAQNNTVAKQILNGIGYSFKNPKIHTGLWHEDPTIEVPK